MQLSPPHASQVDAFVYNALPTRVLFGVGKIRDLGLEMDRFGCKRALIITTPEQENHGEELRHIIGKAAIATLSIATMHTPVAVTERALETTRSVGADILVAIGGGSTVGLSKALALRTKLPQIAIPTTYAGSEMTPILGETDGGKKTTIRDLVVLPQTVIYDVALTHSLPVATSVVSGMNAIAHAAEGVYAKDANPVTSLMAIEGIRVLADALPAIRIDPDNSTARAGALYGAWLCGMVLGSVGMALHHKLCHVLGGAFNLPHAQTHTVVLPHAISYNAETIPDRLEAVAIALGAERPGQGLYDLAVKVGAPIALRDLGLPKEALVRAAKLAVEQPYWNPRKITESGIHSLLDDAWYGRRPSH